LGEIGSNSRAKKTSLILKNYFFYGRRRGPRLSLSKKLALEKILPLVKIDLENINEKILKYKKNNKKIFLEIGFGSGENLIHLIDQNENSVFLGCEPYLNGLASFLKNLEKKDLDKVLIFDDDIRILFNKLNKNLFNKIFILYPDPWPKKRHYKRRLLTEANLLMFGNALDKNGLIFIATDVKQYFEEIKKLFSLSKLFLIVNNPDFLIKPKILGQTNFERKAKKLLKNSYYLVVKKTSG